MGEGEQRNAGLEHTAASGWAQAGRSDNPPNHHPPGCLPARPPRTCMMTNLRLHLDTIFRKVSQAMSYGSGSEAVAVVRQQRCGSSSSSGGGGEATAAAGQSTVDMLRVW